MLASLLEKNSTLVMQTFLLFPTKTELVSPLVYARNPGRDVHLLEPRFDAMWTILASKLGSNKCTALSGLHAYTGSDTSSAFVV